MNEEERASRAMTRLQILHETGLLADEFFDSCAVAFLNWVKPRTKCCKNCSASGGK